jgi:hypothetical protein
MPIVYKEAIMSSIYFLNQHGMYEYVTWTKKKYEVGDVVKLRFAHYPLRVVKISNDNIYCEIITWQ